MALSRARMQRLGRAARKLRGRTLDEAWVRGRQTGRVWLERVGLAAVGREPTLSDLRRWLRPDLGTVTPNQLLERFRRHDRPCRFMPSLDNLPGTVEALRSWCPEHEGAVLTRADRIRSGKFDLLGHRGLRFGDPIDWQVDPLADVRLPLVHWSRIAYLDPAQVGDHKIVWELNRHQHLVTLGQAFVLTQDESYAQTIASHLITWMDQNPPSMGINWASSLEVALRSIAWVWALSLVREAKALTEGLYQRVLGILYLHGRHIERFLSTYFSPNTHLTGEALGLFYLGVLFPEFRRSTRWRTLGQAIMEREITRQVWEDGVYFEQATYYQRYTADFYLHLLILADANQLSLEPETRRRLAKLLEHLVFLQRPDGRTPLIGDDDGGQLIVFAQADPNDFRATLATAAVQFERSDYCFSAGQLPPAVPWLFGRAGAERFASLERVAPEERSKAFFDGGYFVMRSGWDEPADYMVIDCGVHGAGHGGHAHADALAFELAAQGHAMLIDAGTYTYTAEPAWREHFRNTGAHNTVTVRGQSAARTGGPFSWSRAPMATPSQWSTHPSFDFFEGFHDGYRFLEPPARHLRSILFVKGMGWVVRDTMESRGSAMHPFAVHLQCGPDVQVHGAAGSLLTLDAPAARLRVAAFATGGTFEPVDGWVAPVYGRRVEAPAFRFEVPPVSPSQAIMIMVSCRQSEEPRVIELDARAGRVFSIAAARASWEVGIGDANGGGVEATALETDAGWVSIRRTADGRSQEVVALGLTHLRVDGDTILDGADRVGSLVARRVGNRWDVEIGSTSGAP